MSSINPERIAVVSLWAEDVAKTADFYRDVVGLDQLPHNGDPRPHFMVAKTFLVILKGKPIPAQNPDPPRFPLIAFPVVNLETAVEHLQSHGVELPWGIEQDTDSRWVMCYDPAGNLVEFAKFK